MDIFLTPPEKGRLTKWKYHVEDNSITSEYLNPMFNYFTTWIPYNVAPNVVTLIGFICTMYAFYLTQNYFSQSPAFVSFSFALLTFAYMCLDAADGKHARRTQNSSPLGELFDHSCDNVGVVFMMMSVCTILGITDHLSQWYLIQISQLVFLSSHIAAYKDRVVKFGRYTGPGEIICLWIGLALLRMLIPINLSFFSNVLPYIYSGVLGYLIYQSSTINSHDPTRNGLLLCLIVSFMPNLLIRNGLLHVNTMSVIGNGIIFSVVTGDMIVSKIANKEMHPLIPVFVMLSLFDNYLSVALTGFYYVVILGEIACYMRLSLFNIKEAGGTHNVYVNGVYDLCHVGHMNLFEKASSYGTRLIVGVHSDKSVESYKRTPIMTEEERYDVVGKCRFVNEVVRDAPLVIDEEFIRKYNIHTVCCSVEYDKPDDHYYAVPRRMGILRVLPRTDGISTSELLKRISSRKL